MVKKETGKRLRFFIKHSLPDFVESLGGIKFITPGDYKKIVGERGDKEARGYFRQFNQKSYALLESYLTNGDMILIFPEGKLSPKKISPIKLEGLKYFHKVQERIQKEIPLIPMGIEYGSLYHGKFCLPPNKVRVRASAPRYFTGKSLEELADDLQNDFRKLCNL